MTGTELLHSVLTAVSEEDATFHGPSAVFTHLASAELFIAVARALSEKTSDFTLTPGVGLYAIHATLPSFVFPLRVTLAGRQLYQTTLSHVSATDPVWRLSAGTPRRFFVVGGTLFSVYPLPSAETTVQITYVSVPPLLGPSDEPRIGREWSEALVRFSAAVLLCKEGKIQEATGELDGFVSAASLDKDPRFSAGESQGEASRPAIQPSYQPPRG